jgi:hypothetical protein
MRRKRFVEGLMRALTWTLLAGSIAVLGAQSVSAATAQDVSITYTRVFGSPGGTWSATGGINDSGAFAFSNREFTGLGAPVFDVHTTSTFTGTKGTFVMDEQKHFTATASPVVFLLRESWLISEGTGSYSGISGAGTTSAVVDFSQPTSTAILEGKVVLAAP